MRITVVIAGLGGGGAERVCVNLANAWADGGRQVTLLTVTQRGTDSAYAVDARIKRRDTGWPREAQGSENAAPILLTLQREGCTELAGEIPLMAMLRSAILETRPDVVVSHIDLTNVRVLAALHDSGIPVVACEHTDPSRVPLGAWQHAREVFYRRAAAVVASHVSATEWLTRRGVGARTIANVLVPPAPRSESRSGRRRLVTLSRLSPEKRVEMMIRAFRRIAEDLPEWDLEIYGDGPLGAALAEVIDRIGITGRAVLRGFTNDPYGVLAGSDLYVSASCVEGFGNAIWEAMACGVPIVAMDCGAPVRTLVRHGEDGLIVRGGEHALSVALASLMGDDELRNALALRAKEAIERYPFESLCAKWDALLGEVTGGEVAAVPA